MSSPESLEINLRLGWPNPKLLPVKELQHASRLALAQPEAYTRESLLEYGPDDGYEPLRDNVAKWLTTFYEPREPVTIGRICISGGASQNLACVLQSFTDPMITKFIWCIAPTYFCACRIFDDHGFAGRLRAVPEDDEGVDISYLEKELRRCDDTSPPGVAEPSKTPRSWSKTYRHVIYTVPTFSNPSGRIMSLARREALVRLARKHDALIVTDDVYDMLIWDRVSVDEPKIWTTKCQPRIVDVDAYLDGGPIDQFGNSVSQGSFSKILGPGLRTGWAEGTPKFAWGLSQTGQSRSGGCGSQFGAAVLSQIIQTTLPEYLHNVLQPTYARRYHKFMRAIETYLIPLGVTTPPPDNSGAVGGYYVWLDFPQSVQAEEVKARSEKLGLLIHTGSLFQVEGDDSMHQESFINGCRLCFVWVDDDLLVEGIKRLSTVIKRLM